MADRFNEAIQRDLDTAWERGQAHEPYAYACALFFYDSHGKYRYITQSLKYHGDLECGRHFGRMLGAMIAASEHYQDISLVIPVPLHWRRKWKRGYNQAEVIAEGVSIFLGVPVCGDILKRTRSTKTQVKLETTEKSTNVDYLHVWLADWQRNHCECDECVKLRPSDHYVQLLNEIDRKLTDAGLDTKIVFLIYVDLLWAPIKERLNNPDRFVLMFAPITRTYSSSMASSKPFDGVLADYNRNNNKMPSSVSENIAHLKNWQKDFECDSFDFDYHYMWDHFKDIGHFGTDRVLFEDMKNLDKLGLNGMVSCQCIRAFFPHGLGMYCMAEALWNKNADFDNVTHKYFNAAFGDDGDIVSEYMKKLTTLSDPVYMRGEYENTERPTRVH